MHKGAFKVPNFNIKDFGLQICQKNFHLPPSLLLKNEGRMKEECRKNEGRMKEE